MLLSLPAPEWRFSLSRKAFLDRSIGHSAFKRHSLEIKEHHSRRWSILDPGGGCSRRA